MKCIVGLGNPGKAYKNTRHNIGFIVVEELAKRWGLSFSAKSSLQGEIAVGVVGEEKVVLLLPATYMNLSGGSVQACMAYYKVDVSALMVVADDIAIPLRTIRYRSQGSSGGHNGLKNIEESLGTQTFSRLRIGVSDRTEGDLADYVLGKFTEEEAVHLPLIIERSCTLIQEWVAHTLGETTCQV